MADKINFPEWLKKQLERTGMSQSELARAAGVTRAAINGIITGARGPGTDLCNGIAKALRIPPEVVYRAAGLLPPEPAENPIINQITYLGLHKGGIPYGYRKPPGHEYDRKAVLITHPTKSSIVIRIKEMFLAGKSLPQIAAALNDDGIPSPRRGTWTDVKVRTILKNTFYSGEVYFGKTKVIIDPRTDISHRVKNDPDAVIIGKGKHIPLWDKPTQKRIEAEFKKRGQNYAGVRTQRLSHLLYCASCGARVWVQYPGGYYTDKGRRWACSQSPSHVTVKDSDLLPRFVTELTRLLQQADTAPIPARDNTALLQHIQDSITELTRRLDRNHEAFEAGVMDIPEYAQRKSELKSQLKEEQTRLEEAQSTQGNTVIRLQIIGGFKGILKKLPNYITQADPQEVNNQLRTFISKIIISPTTVKIELID